MLTHRNLVANIEQCQHAIFYGDDEVALAALPFFHIYGMQVLMNGLLANGVTVIADASLRHGRGVAGRTRPEDHQVLRRSPDRARTGQGPNRWRLRSLVFAADLLGRRAVGGELADEASARIGCEVVQGYGMTELSPVSHCTVEGDYRTGTSGVTLSNTETRIVDPDTGEDQGVGESRRALGPWSAGDEGLFEQP